MRSKKCLRKRWKHPAAVCYIHVSGAETSLVTEMDEESDEEEEYYKKDKTENKSEEEITGV